MESLEEILNRLNISSVAENIDFNEFRTEVVAEMSVYQLQKNLQMDKESAVKLHKEFADFRHRRPKRPKIQPCKSPKFCETEFSSKFLSLSKVAFKPGDEWSMDICGAAFSASSKAFYRVFKMHGSSSQFGDPNTSQNHKGWTPLMLATVMGRDNVVDLLIREKVTNYLTQNDDGQTAMMLAASFGHSNIIKMLYSKFDQHCRLHPNNTQSSAILNQQDKRGWTPLHYAAAHGQLDAVGILTSYGANPNLPDSNKSTPTLLACEDEAQESSLKLLLQAGGNLEHKNSQGLNGLQIADRDSVNKMYQIYSKKSSHRFGHPSTQYYGSF